MPWQTNILVRAILCFAHSGLWLGKYGCLRGKTNAIPYPSKKQDTEPWKRVHMSKEIKTERQIRYWIVGAGRFGTKALQRLKKKSSSAQITIIDCNPAALSSLRGSAHEAICHDGVDFLNQHLESKNQPHWIIPAVVWTYKVGVADIEFSIGPPRRVREVSFQPLWHSGHMPSGWHF